MPIRLPANLPAFKTLSEEGVMMMSEDTAERQDIRPLEIALLNLMPEKEKTERQFARLIGSTPLQVKLTLVKITSHKPKNTSPDYLTKFYKSFKDTIILEKSDGMHKVYSSQKNTHPYYIWKGNSNKMYACSKSLDGNATVCEVVKYA